MADLRVAATSETGFCESGAGASRSHRGQSVIRPSSANASNAEQQDSTARGSASGGCEPLSEPLPMLAFSRAMRSVSTSGRADRSTNAGTGTGADCTHNHMLLEQHMKIHSWLTADCAGRAQKLSLRSVLSSNDTQESCTSVKASQR